MHLCVCVCDPVCEKAMHKVLDGMDTCGIVPCLVCVYVRVRTWHLTV